MNFEDLTDFRHVTTSRWLSLLSTLSKIDGFEDSDSRLGEHPTLMVTDFESLTCNLAASCRFLPPQTV